MQFSFTFVKALAIGLLANTAVAGPESGDVNATAPTPVTKEITVTGLFKRQDITDVADLTINAGDVETGTLLCNFPEHTYWPIDNRVQTGIDNMLNNKPKPYDMLYWTWADQNTCTQAHCQMDGMKGEEFRYGIHLCPIDNTQVAQLTGGTIGDVVNEMVKVCGEHSLPEDNKRGYLLPMRCTFPNHNLYINLTTVNPWDCYNYCNNCNGYNFDRGARRACNGGNGCNVCDPDPCPTP